MNHNQSSQEWQRKGRRQNRTNNRTNSNQTHSNSARHSAKGQTQYQRKMKPNQNESVQQTLDQGRASSSTSKQHHHPYSRRQYNPNTNKIQSSQSYSKQRQESPPLPFAILKNIDQRPSPRSYNEAFCFLRKTRQWQKVLNLLL